MHDHVRSFLAARGLPYNRHPKIVSNSRGALLVGELARDRGVHRAWHDRVMDTLWAEAADVGDRRTLLRLAEEVGLDRDEAEEVLDTERYLDRVQGSTRTAVSLGITGVPGFLLDDRLLVVGAQPNEVFEGALDRLAGISTTRP